jgi:hypothetical protein
MTTEPGKPAAATEAAWWTRPTDSAPATEVAPAAEKPAEPAKPQANRTTARSANMSTLHGDAPALPASPPKPKRAKLERGDEANQPKVLRCPGCSRANPPDAYYCHHDGKPLFKELQQMPVHIGSLQFPSPFCFSNGQACANFNQLALTCNNLWEEARQLLTEGIWGAFFASMGRLDLTAAARQAASLPDPDRGLSQLIEKFPVDAEFLRPPKLAVSSAELDLGQLAPGTDYTFDLVIQNQGLLLLHGIVVSNFDWLVLGDQVKPLQAAHGPVSLRVCQQPPAVPLRGGPTEKMFQTRMGCSIPVRVLGSKLRAGLKPLLGEIIIDTNGGAATIPVRASVPIRPFPKQPNNVLAGVRLPRELAVRAKQYPNEAGVLFEQGAVKVWYASNGWTYPIEGADGRGAGAVQQFFEALGLTKPPRLEIDPGFLVLKGKVGEVLSGTLTVRTRDARPVYAHGWSNQEWVSLGPPKYLGTRVQFPVTITVPGDQGKTAEARVTLQGNAKQQFVVPVTVTVTRR